MGSAFLSDYVGACFRDVCEQIGEYRMNYFVATTGNDANDGKEGMPWVWVVTWEHIPTPSRFWT